MVRGGILDVLPHDQDVAAGAVAGPDEVVAIDGKTLRRTADQARGLGAVHLDSAWATANDLTLGQVAVDAKPNEITALPQLLALLDLRDCVVTTDAAGRRSQQPSYVCSTQRSDYGLPLCQSLSAAAVEVWVADQILAALRP